MKQASSIVPSSSSKVLARSTPLDLSKFFRNTTTTDAASPSSSFDSGQCANTNSLIVPELEQEHVHKVYDSIADHWDGTRYAPWPRVVEFIQSLPPSSLVADVGCGNGKYMQAAYIGRPVALGRAFVGCDMSRNLVSICAKRGFNALVCDGLLLPYRDGAFDAAISIAVFHHISTHERRLRALGELARIVRIGGRILIYAWAQEQQEESRRRFESQDVLVPWHLKEKKMPAVVDEQKMKKMKTDDTDDCGSVGKQRGNKRAKIEDSAKHTTTGSYKGGKTDTSNVKHKVFQRYCHVYRKGDLEGLVGLVANLKVLRSYFDCSNWAIVVERV